MHPGYLSPRAEKARARIRDLAGHVLLHLGGAPVHLALADFLVRAVLAREQRVNRFLDGVPMATIADAEARTDFRARLVGAAELALGFHV